MGAFLICKRKKINDVDPAIVLFAEMGFTSPTSFETGEWMIYAYPRMVDDNCHVISYNGCRLVSAGSIIYKGLDCCDSLTALLKDYLSGNIVLEQLIGQYTLLFCSADSIEILCDPLGSKHIFTDNGHSFFSSHMLPVCQCVTGDLHINRKAFYEKFLTGIIMPPNTIFREIVQIDRRISECINQENAGIKFI